MGTEVGGTGDASPKVQNFEGDIPIKCEFLATFFATRYQIFSFSEILELNPRRNDTLRVCSYRHLLLSPPSKFRDGP